MISSGRYRRHLQDIAKLERKPKPLNPVHEFQLTLLKQEVAEYEAVHPAQKRTVTDKKGRVQVIFEVGDVVAWNESDSLSRAMRRGYGPGPFKVTYVTPALPGQGVGHTQLLELALDSTSEPIRNTDGRVAAFSGVLLTHGS